MTLHSAPATLQDDACDDIHRILDNFFRTRMRMAAAYGDSFVRLWELAADNVRGGKLVRPRLLVAMFDGLREDDDRAEPATRQIVAEIAAAVELLHFAFLLHDDVIDGDLTRRGRPNLVGALLADAAAGADSDDPPWDSKLHSDRKLHSDPKLHSDRKLHWARSNGILMGNLLLSHTHQVFARALLPAAVRERLLDLLDHTITESVAGEQLDVGLGDGMIEPELATIVAMSAQKTATYTFELPLRAAAILAGADAGVERALATAGYHLGLAFQLQDDLLSTFGDPGLHGKDAFSDLREGKQTTLIAHARRTTSWPQIAPLFGRESLSANEAQSLRTLLEECGARAFVGDLVAEQLAAFHGRLSAPGHPIAAEPRRVLLAAAATLTGRVS